MDNFYKRFNIVVGIEALQQKFINRINILVMEEIVEKKIESPSFDRIERNIAIKLGSDTKPDGYLPDYYENDYHNCLIVLEVIYNSLVKLGRKKIAQTIGIAIKEALQESEFDLGIEWKYGQFIPKGAVLLDKELINKDLDWLSEKKYHTVYTPFSLGLKHFLESGKKPDLLKNVVRDMYEALEALAKIITGRDSKDLSANKDLFISNVNASDDYKDILKTYITYANKYRHAESKNKERAELKRNEVESFIYLTGIFIRLCINQDNK
jgi:hypothetical protein